jgi:subtilisin family serine protease
MHPHAIRGTSVAIVFLFTATFAAPGVAVAAARASAALEAVGLLDLSAGIADGLLEADARWLDAWLGDAPAVRPRAPALAGPVEVVIGLEGRSLAAEQSFRAERGLPLLGPAEQRAYVSNLRASQAALRGSLESAGARVTHGYQIVYNGLALSADGPTLQRIGSLPGVARVMPTTSFEIALDNSVPFLFGGQSNEDLGADGEGVTIAIIDSGIDYTHAAFGGSGNATDWAENNRTIIEPGTFPTAKVVGGVDLVGEFYDARGSNEMTRPNCTAVQVPDPDPLDHNGHGTHVAGIAAGMPFDTFPQGIAPAASLLAIKLFSGCADDGTASTSSANVVAAIEIAADPNGDGDTSDHADVINMSLGGGFGRDTEATAVASNAAVDLGIIVVASAGNSGNVPYITGSPAVASKAISVAAGNDPGVTVQLVGVANSNGSDGNYESLEAAITPLLADTGAVSGIAVRLGNPGTPAAQACSTGATPSPPAPGSLTGKIPLIERGVCTFAEKILNAQAAGAVAVVVYNNAAGAGPIVMGGDPTNITIPAVMIGNPDGVFISARIDADTTFTLDPANVLSIPNRLQSFTSRGPRFGDSAIKPDVTAPGGSILSASVGTGTGGAVLSGTSMSSPHVAGVAALARDLHPEWTIAEIKALLMNTATNAEPTAGIPYPVSLMGAGRVRVDAAAASESVVVPGSLSFGLREQVNAGTKTFNAQLELRNKGSTTKSFALTSGLLFASDNEGSVSLSHPSSLSVGPGQTRKFSVSLAVNFSALAPEAQFEEYDGFLTVTETTTGGDVLRVPFLIVPIARAEAKADDDLVTMPSETAFNVTNRGVRSTSVDIYQFGVSDRNEDLIAEAPGMPSDPDDWFDVRMTGAHSFPLGATRVIEFGLDFHGVRSAPSLLYTEVYIDVNGSGPDFVAVVADDLFLNLSTAFTGRMVSAVFNMTGASVLQFVVNSDRNQGWRNVPIRLDSLNSLGGPDLTLADPDFEYFAVTYDADSGAFDVTDTAAFNVFSPARSAAPALFSLAAGASRSVAVAGPGPGDLLLLYYNNRAGHHQGQRVRVTGP